MRKSIIFILLLFIRLYLSHSQTLELDFLMKKEAKINAYYNQTVNSKDRGLKLRVLENILEDYEKRFFD